MANSHRNLKALKNDLHVRLQHLPDLDRLLFEIVQQVPRGRVTTYGNVAEQLGDRIASKWVGLRLLNHRHNSKCHCHRIVRSGGELGGYVSKNPLDKLELLTREGIRFDQQKIDMSEFEYQELSSTKPLAELRMLQQAIVDHINVEQSVDSPRYVAGVDVSYSGSQAVAALVVVDLKKLNKTDEVHVVRSIKFPYISTYLAFRELPLLLAVLEASKAKRISPDVIMVDGSGILHPRRTGIATMLGVIVDIPTIGVTKKCLVGKPPYEPLEFGSPCEILVDQTVRGHAVLPTKNTNKPIFISPGHKMSVAATKNVTTKCLDRHRLPEPIYWADRISRQIAKQLPC